MIAENVYSLFCAASLLMQFEKKYFLLKSSLKSRITDIGTSDA